MTDIQSTASISNTIPASDYRKPQSGNSDLFSNQIANTVVNTERGFRQGQLGADLNAAGNISRIILFDSQGNELTTSSADPATLQSLAKQFGIDKAQFSAFSQTLFDKGHDDIAQKVSAAASENKAQPLQFNTSTDKSINTQRLGADLNAAGNISRIIFFDEQGEELTTSSADPATLQALGKKFGVDQSQFAAFSQALFAKGHDDIAEKVQQVAATSASNAPTEQQKQPLEHADYVSGRIGISLDKDGVPANIVYFDKAGQPETRSAFDAEAILRNTEKFAIPLDDLTGLGAQLKANDIGYLPYQLYPQTGSNHGIDFNDLIKGGMGTAYNWGVDSNIQFKGDVAAAQLQDTQALIERRNLTYNASLNTPQQPVAANAEDPNQMASTAPVPIDKESIMMLKEKAQQLNLQQNPEIAAHLERLFELISQQDKTNNS